MCRSFKFHLVVIILGGPMQHKINNKWLNRLLSKSGVIRKELDLFLIADGGFGYDKENIDTNSTGKEMENGLVRKITDDEYVFKSKCLECVDKLYSEMNFITKDIMTMRFKLGYSIERICYEVNYSSSSIYSIIKKEKCKLRELINNELDKM